MSFISKIFGDANDRYVKSLQPIVDKINSLEPEYKEKSDEELKESTNLFRDRIQQGETLDDILPEAFTAVRESAKRTLGQRHFDVQLIGGIVLHQGKIAEMRTGEGKTLVSTLPVYLNALMSEGVHIVTVNDYLSRRDTAWMGQIYNALGMSVGCVNHDASFLYDPSHRNKAQETNDQEELDKERDMLGAFKVVHEFLRPVSKKEAYGADITYGTNNEYGFDYLRDNMAYDPASMSQREHHFTIVDEVDSILIDEARTPLIISAPDTDSGKMYETFAKVVPSLVENQDYDIDEKRRAVSITESGIEKVEKMLNVSNIYAEGGIRYVHHLEQALKAQILFKREKDYVVREGEVIIVDEFTGRLMPGRRWSEGLHQAVEAKERVSVQKESRTLATITFQNYFRLYKKLAGMTGTAQTSAEEFSKVYGLDVISIPTNKPIVREDMQDRIYKTEKGKFTAVAREVKEKHEKGQPVLIGTVSIEKNEYLSAVLKSEGIPHNVLNAKNHEREAEIVAQAGRFGGVTVATNMAGRGVDIILGGNPPEEEDGKKVCEAGGLHVIGTERHEARRIDDQLRGRGGRQGDPGSSQFFVSTEDDVVRVFGGDRLKNLMETLGIEEDQPIEHRFISKAIEQAQAKVEGHNFDIRKYVLEYDDVINKHRESLYGLRKKILFSRDSKDLVSSYLYEQIDNLVRFHAPEEDGEINVKEIAEAFKAMAGTTENIQSELLAVSKDGPDKITEVLKSKMKDLYEAKEKETGEEQMRQLEKIVLLRTIDELWMDHIETVDYLKQSVQLRGYGQRDPLVEYKIEAQKLFEQLQNSIKLQVSNVIFKVGFMAKPVIKMEEANRVAGGDNKENNIPSDTKGPGRNDPCPCGSGKKYKRCHGA